MSKITLKVSKENTALVLKILENLKAGLIEEIQVEEKPVKRQAVYQPKEKKIIKEGEAVSGKYIDPASFKARLKQTAKK